MFTSFSDWPLHIRKALFFPVFLAVAPGAQAQETPVWRLGAFWAVWAETNLPELPYNAVTGKLTFHDAHLTALELSRVMVPDFTIPTPFGDWRGHRLELAGQVVKHWGKQKHAELTGALVWRTPDWHFSNAASVNFAYGNGFSYALKPPRYEKGPEGIRGVNTKQFQFYILTEFELTPADAPDWHLVFRLHHRSGIWGVISPRKTGSNYLGLGLRRDF